MRAGRHQGRGGHREQVGLRRQGLCRIILRELQLGGVWGLVVVVRRLREMVIRLFGIGDSRVSELGLLLKRLNQGRVCDCTNGLGQHAQQDWTKTEATH